MNPSFIQEIANCDFSEACDILEIIEQILPMSDEGKQVLQKPLGEQIKIARLVLAA
jgi:hypothetical protein